VKSTNVDILLKQLTLIGNPVPLDPLFELAENWERIMEALVQGTGHTINLQRTVLTHISCMIPVM
jgi:hypothetical protein